MTEAELSQALAVGAAAVDRAMESHVHAIGLGEMGIGNTTAASALLAALLKRSAAATVGRGTGVDDAAFAHKRAVVDRALETHVDAVASGDARECLRRLGGLELASIAGAALEGARRGVAVVADGFISTVAVLAAARIAAAEDAALLAALTRSLFLAHRSAELAHGLALDACGETLGVSSRPVLELDMRLGEGTGAALAMPVLRAAAAVMREMATFASAGVSAGSHAEVHSVLSPE